MRLNKKGLVKGVAIILTAILGISFCVYQIRLLNVERVKTQTTYLQSVYRTVNTDVFVIRDEKYITNDASGVLVSLVENGMRVARDDTVAVVLKNESDAAKYAKKQQLAEEIAYYEGLSAKSMGQSVNIQGIDNQIYKSVEEYINVINSNNFAALKEASNAVRDNITHKQSVTGTSFDFSEILDKLRAEYKSLDVSSMGTDIKASNAGYYISDIDGYENTAVYENVSSMGISDIDALLKSQPQSIPSGVTGKLVGNFDWYIVCVLESKYAADLTLNSEIIINMPLTAAGDIRATIYKISEAEDGRTAVIFSVNDMNESLATLRKESAKIRIESYSGYRIDNRAIRMREIVETPTSETTSEGETAVTTLPPEETTTKEKEYEKGVYILRENVISFRKIEVIYSEEAFSIVKKASTGNYLRIYDEVIIEGTDLYDGKLLS